TTPFRSPPSHRRRTTPAAKAQTTADFWHFAKTRPLFFGTAGKLYKSGFGSLTFPTNRVILCSSKAKALTDQSLSALFVFLPAVRTPRSERIEGSPSGACARPHGRWCAGFLLLFLSFYQMHTRRTASAYCLRRGLFCIQNIPPGLHFSRSCATISVVSS